MADSEKVQERLRRIEPVRRPPSVMRRYALPAGMLVAGLAGGAYLATVQPSDRAAAPPMETSEPGEFPSGGGLADFTTVEGQPAPEPQPVAVRTEVQTVADPQAQADAEAARRDLAKAKADLETARAELAAAQASPGVDPTQLAALHEELQQMRDETALRDQAFDELNRDNMRLQTELETAAQLAGQSQMETDLEAQQLAALEQRRAEMEARRAEEEARMEARIRSPSIAYRAGGGGGAEGGDGAEGQDAQLDEADRFRRAGKAETIQAQVISAPSRTVVQGTLIEATLTNAISSQLEGNVSATVSYDVWSMDMADVVIPRGSRLFGRYSSSIEKGQRRIMVAWDRVITPDGQSAELAAYGTDRIGRSGVTGKVNTHALSRFAAASAVSIIGAVPTILSAAVEKDRNDEVSRDTVESLGNNMSDTVGGMMKDYIDIPTTISVDQGAVVMVMVNADLEML